MRWKNDAGVTREVATGPGWRVAIADLATSGPFSTFPGIDRVLYLLEGPPVTLVVDGVATAMAPLDAVAFPGEATTSVLVDHGPTRDLNVMVERGIASVTHAVVELVGELVVADRARTLVHVVGGEASAGDATARAGDSLLLSGGVIRAAAARLVMLAIRPA